MIQATEVNINPIRPFPNHGRAARAAAISKPEREISVTDIRRSDTHPPLDFGLTSISAQSEFTHTSRPFDKRSTKSAPNPQLIQNQQDDRQSLGSDSKKKKTVSPSPGCYQNTEFLSQKPCTKTLIFNSSVQVHPCTWGGGAIISYLIFTYPT